MDPSKVRIALGEESVSGLLLRLDDAKALYVFAHGAGAGMTHRSMESNAQGLAARGIATLRYQFPYMEKGGRRPDPPRVAHAAVRAAVAEAAAGVWSVPEADLAVLLAGSRVLPDLWANPTLHDHQGRRLTTPDLWCDDVALAVMVHSRQFHAGVLDWDATVDGDSDLSTARIAVVGITPTSLARDPAGILRRVEAAYLALRSQGAPRPEVRATPRSRWDRPAAG